MTLLEAKDKIAIKYGFKDWSDYLNFMIATKVPLYKAILATDFVAELYMDANKNSSNEPKVVRNNEQKKKPICRSCGEVYEPISLGILCSNCSIEQ